MRALVTIAAVASVVATGAIAATAGLFLANSAIAVPALEARALAMPSAQVSGAAQTPQGQLVASSASAMR